MIRPCRRCGKPCTGRYCRKRYLHPPMNNGFKQPVSRYKKRRIRNGGIA